LIQQVTENIFVLVELKKLVKWISQLEKILKMKKMNERTQFCVLSI